MNLGELGGFLFDQPLLALTIAAILLAVLAGMLAANRPRLAQGLRNTAYLGLIGALLLTVAELAGHNTRSEAAMWLDRTQNTASRAGLAPDEGDEGMVLDTANGPIVARKGTASSLRFGGIDANGLTVAIAPNTEVETNVIGMNLLSQLASWRVEDNKLILVPKTSDAQIGPNRGA